MLVLVPPSVPPDPEPPDPLLAASDAAPSRSYFVPYRQLSSDWFLWKVRLTVFLDVAVMPTVKVNRQQPHVTSQKQSPTESFCMPSNTGWQETPFTEATSPSARVAEIVSY